MSRIIVKNLPAGLKEERLREIFSSEGHITDCALKFTKEGHFRKFAFIGFSKDAEANNAVKRRDKSFIDTSRIHVEFARDLGDANKPRAWSKYAADSSAFKKADKKKSDEILEEPKQKKKKTSDDHLKDMLGDLKDDAGFEEFLSLHQNKANKATWGNDVSGGKTADKTKNDRVDSDSESANTDEEDLEEEEEEEKMEESESEESEEETEERKETVADKSGVSDLDYLKAKKTESAALWSESESDSEEQERQGNKTKSKDAAESDSTASDDSDDDDDSSDDDSDDESESAESDESGDEDKTPKVKREPAKFKFLVKMRGLPTTIKEGQIRDYFKPVVPVNVKIPKNAKGKQAFCIATVEFKDESQQDAAMRKNKNFIGPKKIFLHKLKEKIVAEVKTEKQRPWELQEADGEAESIGESGRLYIRNLAYVCTEENLEELFGKYGPLSEVHLPIDRHTKKIKGFAFITFMIPEHAVKAHAELDGSNFQGRLLHILPGKAQKEDASATEPASFKKKKEAQQKAQAGSSHNWNTLFLGANAVVDVMADKYGTAKSDILKADGKNSLGVRLALGETQVVAETRNFLVENGIALDAFSQAAAARSKTVLLAKNLPAGTKAEELTELFGKFGTLGRVVLPPSGVTAVIEYIAPTEAKAGFQRLAYTRFQHLPLYLEWAPVDVFVKPAAGAQSSEDEDKKASPSEPSTSSKSQEADDDEEESSSSEEESDEPGRTLFVKNLNFDTTEDSLKELFASVGKLKAVTVAKKKDMKNPGNFLSMGYGFVEYKSKDSCQKAMKQLQHSSLDEHQLELKLSNRATVQAKAPQKKKKQDATKKQRTSKILVRNIPFEAKHTEVQELFSVFGELKSVRMPKKVSGTGSHRGFAFVDFLTKQDAKRAFGALCHSTHLYGRRLVLEWANTEDDSLDYIRDKTAQHYHSGGSSKKLKKSGLMDELKLSTL